MTGRRKLALSVWSAMAIGLTACAPKRFELPTGAGTPFPDAPAAYQTAIHECRGARTIAASLALSGRAGSTSLRGHIDAGFESPDRLRLEGRHPIGRPVFIMVASGARATLFLPRDHRVLRDVAPDEIVEALIGLPLDPAALRSLVSGCGFTVGEPAEGRSFPGGWVAVDVNGTTAYLREVEGRWRVIAATQSSVSVAYSVFSSGRPSTLRVQAHGAPTADLTVRLSDVNINVPLEPAAFEVTVPADADPLSIAELRRAGPLGER